MSCHVCFFFGLWGTYSKCHDWEMASRMMLHFLYDCYCIALRILPLQRETRGFHQECCCFRFPSSLCPYVCVCVRMTAALPTTSTLQAHLPIIYLQLQFKALVVHRQRSGLSWAICARTSPKLSPSFILRKRKTLCLAIWSGGMTLAKLTLLHLNLKDVQAAALPTDQKA